MPKPSKRTRSEKRVYKSLPGGGNKIHYKQEINALRICHLCKQPLAGFQHVSASGVSKLSRSKRRIWRPYGGQVCHDCLKNSLRQAARAI